MDAVIVVDDASTDDTADVVGRIALEYSGRVVVKRLERNYGPGAARNIGLGLSTAPWVAVLDADDFFLQGRMEQLLSYADDNDFIADDLLQVDESDDGRQSRLFEALVDPRQLNLEQFVLGNLSRPGRLRKELGFLKPLMRRSFLDQHSLRYDESLRLGEDYALYARALAMRARFIVIPACGYVSVVRSDSISGRHSLADLERFRDVNDELSGIPGLGAREKRALRCHYRSVDARAQWVAVILATKARSPSNFLAPFFRSWTVSRFLLENLMQQLYLRGGRLLSKLRRRTSDAIKQSLRA